MRIGFDAKRLFNNFTGLGNYSRFVVNALLDYAPGNDYLLYTPKLKSHSDITAITSRERVEVITPPSLFKYTKTSSLWRTWGIGREASVQNLTAFHGLSQELPLGFPVHVKKLVTIHDLIFLRFPELYHAIDARIYKAKVNHACRTADQIIAISHQTAEDLQTFLNVPSSKIKVIYQGCHKQFRQRLSNGEVDLVKRKYQLPEKYLLNVGTVERRKNVMLAVKALAQLRNRIDFPLVIVGRRTAYKQDVVTEALRLGISDRLIFLHQVPFEDLPAIYQGASIFMYPSLFEGFGIPIVEALESGVPVISSKGSCFEEAGGTDTIYVDPDQPDALANEVLAILTNDSLRQTMIGNGRRYARRFEPARIAEDLINVYR